LASIYKQESTLQFSLGLYL